MITYHVRRRPLPVPYRATGSLSGLLAPTKRPDGTPAESRKCYSHPAPVAHGTGPAVVVDQDGRLNCHACAAAAVRHGLAAIGEVEPGCESAPETRVLRIAAEIAEAQAVTVLSRALDAVERGITPEARALHAALSRCVSQSDVSKTRPWRGGSVK